MSEDGTRKWTGGPGDAHRTEVVAECERLTQVVAEFGKVQVKRLFQKVDVGWLGWDDPKFAANMLERFDKKSALIVNNLSQGRKVPPFEFADAANFLMFFWWMQVRRGNGGG